jgi:hypothetical protein
MLGCLYSHNPPYEVQGSHVTSMKRQTCLQKSMLVSVCAVSPNENPLCTVVTCMGRDSSVGMATGYGLDGPGIESQWGRGEIFRACPDRPWGPPNLLYNGYQVFPGGKAAEAWR